MLKSTHLLALALLVSFAFSHCKKEAPDSSKPTGTCSDGLLNQDETNIDCGGVCSVCQTCSDGKQNQGETAVDCGGPCAPCPIVYPEVSSYGKNILFTRGYDTNYVAGANVSIAAQLPAGTRIKVRVRNIGGVGYAWYYATTTIWVMSAAVPQSSYQEFTAYGPGMADLMFRLGNAGQEANLQVGVFENGDTSMTWSKVIKYKSY